ncbi:hypothetical protein MMC34_004769 [Xylographa carneopallida]|nr:hypothetical protein [Xylographa carneopallida]
MDGITTIASILPLAALTLQSIKLIREAVIDGPKNLSRLAVQATSLHGLVKQIDELLVFVEQADIKVFSGRLDELQKAVQLCNKDL